MYLEPDAIPGSFTMSFGGLYPDRIVPRLNQTIRVCRACNGGWMAQLEQRAMPGLLLLRAGEPTVLGPDGQRLLACWLMKTAIVREFSTPAGHPLRVSTADQRAIVAAGRVPPGWRVAIGAYEGPGPNLEHHFSTVKRLVGSDGQGHGDVVLHTVRFECFVGQILVHSTPDPPIVDALLGGPPYALELVSDHPQAWPPTGVLDRESLQTIREFDPDNPRVRRSSKTNQ